LTEIAGESQCILKVYKLIIQYAQTTVPVLVTGPTGSGKEVVGRALHACSLRKDKSFVGVNCAAIPKGLLESELFGHERWAFTGAHIQRKGKFEQANGGMLFLDEVGDLSKAAQAKILRAIQEGEIWRVGGTKPIKVGVRFIAATNKNLAEAIRNGGFREDLYDRLNGGEITLKPLEERLEDLQPLVDHFIKKHELAREQAPYSSYDIFCWIKDYYLQADDGDEEDCEVRLTFEEMISRTMQLYDPDSRPEHHFQARKNVRRLEMAVQLAAARGTLRRYGSYAFIDVLEDNNVTTYGPRYYSNDELQQSDWVIAQALTRFQQDAGHLMGIHDPKNVSKTLKRLGLSKKQRKG
jgi:hypothetical protein